MREICVIDTNDPQPVAKEKEERIWGNLEVKKKKKKTNIKPHNYLHSIPFDSNQSVTGQKDCRQACWRFYFPGMGMAVDRGAGLSVKLILPRYPKLCCTFLCCRQPVLLVILQSQQCNAVGLSPTARNAAAPSQPPALTTISLQILLTWQLSFL